MPTFITNQSQLAKAAGVSSQWLSAVKGTDSASDDLLAKLELLTGIPQVYWISYKRKLALDQKLETFLSQQKEQEALSEIN